MQQIRAMSPQDHARKPVSEISVECHLPEAVQVVKLEAVGGGNGRRLEYEGGRWSFSARHRPIHLTRGGKEPKAPLAAVDPTWRLSGKCEILVRISGASGTVGSEVALSLYDASGTLLSAKILPLVDGAWRSLKAPAEAVSAEARIRLFGEGGFDRVQIFAGPSGSTQSHRASDRSIGFFGTDGVPNLLSQAELSALNAEQFVSLLTQSAGKQAADENRAAYDVVYRVIDVVPEPRFDLIQGLIDFVLDCKSKHIIKQASHLNSWLRIVGGARDDQLAPLMLKLLGSASSQNRVILDMVMAQYYWSIANYAMQRTSINSALSRLALCMPVADKDEPVLNSELHSKGSAGLTEDVLDDTYSIHSVGLTEYDPELVRLLIDTLKNENAVSVVACGASYSSEKGVRLLDPRKPSFLAVQHRQALEANGFDPFELERAPESYLKAVEARFSRSSVRQIVFPTAFAH